MIKLNLSNFALVFASAVLLCGCSAAEKTYTKDAFAFDTYITVTDYSGSEDTANEVISLLNNASGSFSKAYDTNAAMLNDEMLSDCAVKTAVLNQKYGDAVNLTCGALTRLWGISTDSPSVPSADDIENAMLSLGETDYFDGDFSLYGDDIYLDFGAAAKGYACDLAYDLLSEKGGCDIVSLGSSTLLFGEKPDGTLFSAAVKNPEVPSEYLGVLKTSSAFISTSGGYERFFEENGVKYRHIISTETGYPVETDLTSVTVIVPSDTENGGLLSDFLATAIYSEGTAGLEKYLADGSFYIIAADENKNVFVSGGVDFELDEASGYKLK